MCIIFKFSDGVVLVSSLKRVLKFNVFRRLLTHFGHHLKPLEILFIWNVIFIVQVIYFLSNNFSRFKCLFLSKKMFFCRAYKSTYDDTKRVDVNSPSWLKGLQWQVCFVSIISLDTLNIPAVCSIYGIISNCFKSIQMIGNKNNCTADEPISTVRVGVPSEMDPLPVAI